MKNQYNKTLLNDLNLINQLNNSNDDQDDVVLNDFDTQPLMSIKVDKTSPFPDTSLEPKSKRSSSSSSSTSISSNNQEIIDYSFTPKNNTSASISCSSSSTASSGKDETVFPDASSYLSPPRKPKRKRSINDNAGNDNAGSPNKKFLSPTTASVRTRGQRFTPTKTPNTKRKLSRLPFFSGILKKIKNIINQDVYIKEKNLEKNIVLEKRKKLSEDLNKLSTSYIKSVANFYSHGVQRDVNKTNTLHIVMTLQFERLNLPIGSAIGHYEKAVNIFGKAIKVLNNIESIESRIENKYQQFGFDEKQKQDILEILENLKLNLAKHCDMVLTELNKNESQIKLLKNKGTKRKIRNFDKIITNIEKKGLDLSSVDFIETYNVISPVGFNKLSIKQMNYELLSSKEAVDNHSSEFFEWHKILEESGDVKLSGRGSLFSPNILNQLEPYKKAQGSIKSESSNHNNPVFRTLFKK